MSAVQARGLGIATAGRWLGLLVGLALSSWLIGSGWSELVVLFIGPALGIPLLCGVLLGALARPGPERGPARRALLETRRIDTYLPPWTWLVRWLTAGYVGLTVLGVQLTPSTFDGGHNVAVYVDNDGLGVSLTRVPPSYAVSSLTLVLIGLGAGVGMLHLLVRRPRPAGIDVVDDDQARTDAAAAVVAACAVLVAVPLAGLSLLAAAPLFEASSSSLGDLAGAVPLLVSLASLAVAGWALANLLVPRGRS